MYSYWILFVQWIPILMIDNNGATVLMLLSMSDCVNGNPSSSF